MTQFINYLKSVSIPISLCLIIYLIDPYFQGYLFGWISVVIVLLNKKFILKNLDQGFVLLLIFSITYALFYSFNPSGGIQLIFNYAFIPSGFYLIGKLFVKEQNTTKNLFILLILIGFLFSFSALASVLIVFQKTGFSSIERNLPMFWNGTVVSATNMSSFFVFNLCLPGLLLIKQLKFSPLFKIIGGIIFFLSLICVIRLGSRTQLVLSLLMTIVAVAYALRRQSIKKNYGMLFMLIVLIGIVLTQVSFDADADWMTLYASRMEDSQNVASAGGRSMRWERAIENLFTKPMGWSKKEFGYAHNMWLDTAMIGGVMPMIFLLLFSVKSFFDIKKTLNINRNEISFNALTLVYSLSLFIVFFVEPILVGYFKLFSIFCLFMGMLVAYNTQKSRYS